MTKLLELAGTAEVQAIERFAVADHYQVGTVDGVRVVYVGPNFQKAFGNKVEENVPGGRIRLHTLLQDSRDPPIIAALAELHEMRLAELWQLIKVQGQGVLLVNGYPNIGYVRDDEGTLWAVCARWRGDGWYFGANSVERPDRWGAGRQVLSY